MDELWLGVKGQSNLEIAGSPRNSFRASLVISLPEVEHCLGKGPYKVYQPQANSECRLNDTRESVGVR